MANLPVRCQYHVDIVRILDLCQRIINHILELHRGIRDKQIIVNAPYPVISVKLDRSLDIRELIPDAERPFEMESEVVAMLLGVVCINTNAVSKASGPT